MSQDYDPFSPTFWERWLLGYGISHYKRRFEHEIVQPPDEYFARLYVGHAIKTATTGLCLVIGTVLAREYWPEIKTMADYLSDRLF